MPITRHHSGRWYYQFDRVIAGRRTRANRLLPEGTTRAQALDFDRRETARLFQVATGGDKPEPLIADAVLLYLKEHAPNLKNHKDVVGALAIMEPEYANKPLSALPDVAREYAKTLGIAKGTIKNRLAYLRAACRWAWKHHGLGEHDPAERMVLPKVKNARQVYLSRSDMLRICRKMGLSWSRDVARVAFYTGMRVGEALRSSRMEIDGMLALSVADTKNGLPRIVPVHPKIAHLVRGHWPPAVTVWTASKAVGPLSLCAWRA
jgi:integrase